MNNRHWQIFSEFRHFFIQESPPNHGKSFLHEREMDSINLPIDDSRKTVSYEEDWPC